MNIEIVKLIAEGLGAIAGSATTAAAIKNILPIATKKLDIIGYTVGAMLIGAVVGTQTGKYVVEFIDEAVDGAKEMKKMMTKQK